LENKNTSMSASGVFCMNVWRLIFGHLIDYGETIKGISDGFGNGQRMALTCRRLREWFHEEKYSIYRRINEQNGRHGLSKMRLRLWLDISFFFLQNQ
jgi:hypothetical protein